MCCIMRQHCYLGRRLGIGELQATSGRPIRQRRDAQKLGGFATIPAIVPTSNVRESWTVYETQSEKPRKTW